MIYVLCWARVKEIKFVEGIFSDYGVKPPFCGVLLLCRNLEGNTLREKLIERYIMFRRDPRLIKYL